MIQRALMITALRKQHDLLKDLMQRLETRSCRDAGESLCCSGRFEAIARNLKNIRQKHQTYCDHLADSYTPQ